MLWHAPAIAQSTDYGADHADDGYEDLPPAAEAENDTYDEDTIAAIADNFFGGSSEALAKILQKVFSDLGQPTAYIEGEEGSGAAVIGGRVGKGQLTHKIEGTRKIYWIGPSIGLDLGGNLSKTFTLVYNLDDSDDIYRRFAGVDGSFYYIAGLGVNYQRRGNIVLAPIRSGVGLRVAGNFGWVHYTRKRTWFPF
ncbi:MAG: DUF1134 domain-containing protein [Sphingomonadales bacterium]